VTDAYLRSLTFSYTGTRLSQVLDSASRSVSYGLSGTSFTFTDAEAKTETYAMDSNYLMTSVVDGRSRTVVQNDYDTTFRVYQQRTFGDAGKQTTIGVAQGMGFEKDPSAGKEWTYFDSRGRKIYSLDPLNNVSFCEYDGADRLTGWLVQKAISPPLGTTAYDVLTSVKDPAGHERTITPDPQHRPAPSRISKGKQPPIPIRISTGLKPSPVLEEFCRVLSTTPRADCGKPIRLLMRAPEPHSNTM